MGGYVLLWTWGRVGGGVGVSVGYCALDCKCMCYAPGVRLCSITTTIIIIITITIIVYPQYDRRNQRVGFGYAACQRLGMDLAPPCDVMSVLQGDMVRLLCGLLFLLFVCCCLCGVLVCCCLCAVACVVAVVL